MPRKEDIIIREVKTKWTHVFLRADNIVVTEEVDDFPQESSISIAEEILAAIEVVCAGEVYPMLSRFGNRQINKEERRFYMSHNSHSIREVAMIVDNPFQRMLANFFLGINKVPAPSKVFTNEEKAVVWLNAQQEKN